MKKLLFFIFLTVILIGMGLYLFNSFFSETVNIALPNTPLIVRPGTKVTLDGEVINDTAKELTYNWSFYSLPENSNAMLSDSTATRPSFTADLPGDYFIYLKVNNDKGDDSQKGYVVYAYDFSYDDSSRPIKIPSGVEIQYAKPETVYANENNNIIELRFVLSRDISEGSVLGLGWEKNIIISKGNCYIKTDGGVVIRELQGKQFHSPVDLSAGNTIIVTLLEADFPVKGRKVFYLECIDKDILPKAQFLSKFIHMDYQFLFNPQKIIGACLLNVEGGEIDHIRAYAPSQVIVNKPFSILIRPEDENNNLSHKKIKSIEIHANNKIRELKCIENSRSSICKATFSLPAEGIYRLKIADKYSGKFDITNPVICKDTPDKYNAYWGVIHGHSEMSWDGTGNLDLYYLQMRDEAFLDFGASSEHCNLLFPSDVLWESISQKVKKYNKPREFVTFLGYEWDNWLADGNGDVCLYYLDEKRPMYRSLYYPGRVYFFDALRKNREKVIVIPHHTAVDQSHCNWENHAPEFERLIEIFSVWGCFECSKEEGNPLHTEKKETVPHGYVRDALARGWRVGFTAGGDDHSGTAGIDGLRNLENKDGVMSVFATGLTREEIWEALFNRRVVATTGERMILNYDLDGYPMGSELDTAANPDLRERRRLRIEFHGTAPVEQVQIIRNNRIIHSMTGDGLDLEACWEDNIAIDKISMTPNKFSPHPYIFYYIRAIQSNGERAWASPIWVDVK